jgi:hypothetical protein
MQKQAYTEMGRPEMRIDVHHSDKAANQHTTFCHQPTSLKNNGISGPPTFLNTG